MKKYQLLLLSIISGLLLAFAWFPHAFVPLLFIGFVPLLMVEKIIVNSPSTHKSYFVFYFSFITFFVWNILTTWWIKNASSGGAIMAITANSLLMSFVFLSFHKVKKRVGEKYGSLIFIAFWLTYEFVHLRWDLSWPWLMLGNAFADTPKLIQWYEFTGVLGGSLWVLLVNCLLLSCFITNDLTLKFQIKKSKIVILILLMVLPISISFLLPAIVLKNHTKQAKQYKTVVVQPNIDPYNEKFSGSYDEQLNKMFALASEKTDSSTDYVILPETALQEYLWEGELDKSQSIKKIKNYLKQFPRLKIITGASTNKAYKRWEKLSVTARKFTDEEGYYDSYNTILQLDNSARIQIYHKSKLVPGVEKIPFPFIFNYFEKFALDLGGTTGSLGTQDNRSPLIALDPAIKIAPVICYESIYGEYVTEYINHGANFISIVTNDGWWGNTPGYQQHLKYGALRAIETRRWIARSANTGISCFINPLGEIIQPTKWWTPAVIAGNIELNEEITFYVRFGDYIGRIAICAAFLLILYAQRLKFRNWGKSKV